MTTNDHILGTLYGQAIGDAMGMPAELWPVGKIQNQFGRITTFLDGPANNDIARHFTKGQYTDDTHQALAILDALIETHWIPDQTALVHHILTWAEAVHSWENNVLGPSSKAALTAIRKGEDPTPFTTTALTSGAGMRIAPIGALFSPHQLPQLVDMVVQITRITHATDVALAGAAMIAGATCAAVDDQSWDQIIQVALAANDLAFQQGAPTWAARTHDRLRLALQLADQYRDDEVGFATAIYTLIGTGTMVSESIPAAVAIAYFTRDVKRCALLCANLGGDTDTIGAMATAICGAKNGLHTISPDWITLIETANPKHDLTTYANEIAQFSVR
ncbi:ADP-ribosylglycohydrolase family protein [Secundilactobacillus paracollinoides]|uniref:ADP-ribosylglycohydrolase family protein n=1 Tax=Secundilactobacillus paracollinoides TaxID=240427 RepID=UPI000AF388AC|nr:ADP-ribosylglycohydrolase family protein [Secundilactobacillus paracollinoides]